MENPGRKKSAQAAEILREARPAIRGLSPITIAEIPLGVGAD